MALRTVFSVVAFVNSGFLPQASVCEPFLRAFFTRSFFTRSFLPEVFQKLFMRFIYQKLFMRSLLLESFVKIVLFLGGICERSV